MSFYNPYKKGPDFAQGINDMVSKLMQMVLMKQVFGRDPAQGMPTQTQAEQPTNTPMPQARGQGQMGNPMQSVVGQAPSSFPDSQARSYQGGGGTPMGVGPPGMAQAGMAHGMAQQMPQLMMAIKNNPQLLQMIMQMINPGGMNQGAMMGGGL